MGEKSLTFHQQKAVAALEKLQGICRTHDITLYLLAGTALGAVRNEGMIPWDDDIDVGCLYDDWIKLRKILPNEIGNEFQYRDFENNPGFPRLQGKILYQRQSCIDIFLIAKWTTNKLSGIYHWHIRKLFFDIYLNRLDYKIPMRPGKTQLQIIRYKLKKGIRKLEFLITKPFLDIDDCYKILKENESYFERHPYDCYINLYSCYSMEKEMMKKEWIETRSTVMFEGKEYTTVGNTDAYLRHLYGDYMTPPAEDKQTAAHEELFDI